MVRVNKGDDDIIDLRNASDDEDKPEFKIEHVPESTAPERMHYTRDADLEEVANKSNDKVKIKFNKFVNLIATHNYEETFDKHMDDDVIISTDLLADLANADEDKSDGKKLPMMFIFGIVIGAILVWLLLR